MDIGRLKNNKKYSEESFGETDVIIRLKDNEQFNLHIWEGFFYYIFGTPTIYDNGSQGFTRDFNEFKGAFSNQGNGYTDISNPEEYLKDMLQYERKDFDEETYEVFNLIMDFLRYAMLTGQTVTVKVD